MSTEIKRCIAGLKVLDKYDSSEHCQVSGSCDQVVISLNAARINQGDFLELLPDYEGEKDFYCIFRDEAEDIEQEIISLCESRLQKRYGFDPVRDIQVMTPMRKGVIGAENLNKRLQETLNPATKDPDVRSRQYQIGDKVMQIRNNYDKEVFNGDLGIVSGRSTEEQGLEVNFEGRRLAYDGADLNE